jgi:hypothetical protein
MTGKEAAAELRKDRHRLNDVLEIMGFALDSGDYGLALATERTAMQLLESIARASEAAQLAQLATRTANGDPLAAVTQLHRVGQP